MVRSERILTVEYIRDPHNVWRVAGRTQGFGTFDTKKEAVEKAKRVLREQPYPMVRYTKALIHKKNGALQQEITV